MYERLAVADMAIRLHRVRMSKWSKKGALALAEYLFEQDEIEYGEGSLGSEFNAEAIAEDWELYESKHELIKQDDPDLQPGTVSYCECEDMLTDTYTIVEFDGGIMVSERKDLNNRETSPSTTAIKFVAHSVGWHMKRLTEIGVEDLEHYDRLASYIVECTTQRYSADKAIGVVRDSIRHLRAIASAVEESVNAMELIQESKPLVVLGQGTSRTEIGEE